MGVKTLALWLLLAGTLVSQHCCQHWSYGLSPGGKRELDSLSDTLADVSIYQSHGSLNIGCSSFILYILIVMFCLQQIVEGVPHVDTPCSIMGCAEESPFARIYRMKGLLGSVTDRENGHRTYKKC
ncbi:progonadoliberin-1-like [Trachinotus anak]|uniref:progonadoliberin-1-like n=1 Tax=Trachinotus anak TaxID=443729 RepID=UPI0039F175FC